jgi:hypothetical protein
VTIGCSHPRKSLNLPNRTAGASRVQFQAPAMIPGLPSEAVRAILQAFQSVGQEFSRQAQRGATVPLLDALINARDGQIIRGIGNGQTIVLPQPPIEDGVQIVLDDVSTPVTVVEPDGTEVTLSTPGIYDYSPGGGDDGGFVTNPNASIMGGISSGVVLGRETAGAGAIEELTVGAGLELNSGLGIADLGVTTARLNDLAVATGKIADAAVTFPKLVDAPSAGFIGATIAGDYSHRTTAQVAAVFVSTSIVASGAQLQRAAVTGDVEIPQNSNTATIPNDTVDNPRLDNMAQSRIKGRGAGAGTGDPQDLTPTQVVTIIGADMSTELSSSSIVQSGNELQRAAVSGDVEIAQNSNTATIPSDTVANSQLANMTQATIKGRASGAGTGDPTDLTEAQAAAIVSAAGVFGELGAANTWTAANTFQDQVRLSSVVSFEAPLIISTSASTLDDTDIDPDDHNVVKITGTVFLEVTGITVARNGQLLAVINGSTTNSIDLMTEDTASSAINRFTFGGTDVRLGPARGALLLYDGNSGRWRALFGFP